jgi:hypothetical protein
LIAGRLALCGPPRYMSGAFSDPTAQGISRRG